LQKGGIPILQLIKKAQKGDDAAFLTLFQIYEKDIYRMAYIYVKNEEDALDIVQDVAYRSFSNIKALKNPEFFKTWLLKITINCAITFLKKNKNRSTPATENQGDVFLESEDLPMALTLKGLIDNLAAEEKTVVMLRFYKNHTFKEIAELLEIPLGTAKSILYRALHKLRTEFEKGMV
jgi:RNA polymerase sigma-70 factor (ECF subfamily)